MKEKALNNFRKEIKELIGDEYEVLGSSYDSETKRTTYKIKHKTCGRIYTTTKTKFVNRGYRCRDCSKFSKKNSEWFSKRIFELSGSDYTLIGNYVNTKTKISIKHNNCGKIYEVTPNKFISGRRCPECSHPSKMKIKENFQIEIEKLTNNEFEVLSDYSGKKKLILLKHKLCERSFEITPDNFLKVPSCRLCEKNISNGEHYIESILKDYNIDFKQQLRISECKDKRSLPFDFAIFKDSKIVFLIEYNGRQHYDSNSKFSKNNFEDRQNKDKIKREYCLQNNIDLLIISYSEFKNLKNIISEKLTEYKLI